MVYIANSRLARDSPPPKALIERIWGRLFCFSSLTLAENLLIISSRAKWLKEPNPEAEELFRMVAEVFIFWSKSHVSMRMLANSIYCLMYDKDFAKVDQLSGF